MRGITKRPRTNGCSPRLPAVGKPRNSPNMQAAVGPARDKHTAFVPGHRAEVSVGNFEFELSFAGSDVPHNDRRGFGGISGIAVPRSDHVAPRRQLQRCNNIPLAAKSLLKCACRQIENEDFRTCSAHHEVLSISSEGETKAGHQSILESIAQSTGGYVPYVDIRVIGNRRDFAAVR